MTLSAPTPALRPSAERPALNARTSARRSRFHTIRLLSATARVREAQRNSLLWMAQACLVMAFAGSGFAKLTEPLELLIVLLDWPEGVDPAIVRLLGLMELVLAAASLVPVVSWRIGRGPLVMATAAFVALTAVMIVIHAADRAIGHTLFNVILMGLALTVLRFRAADRRPG